MSKIPHSWMISGLKKSYRVFGLTIEGITQEQAKSIYDGPDGWNILEIMCHVRDYQEIFFGRIKQIINEDNPTFKVYDEIAREALVIDNDYANQNLRETYDEYAATRQKLIEFLSSLTEDQWQRPGIHPMIGNVDITVPIFHTIIHDVDHAEQIGRIVAQR